MKIPNNISNLVPTFKAEGKYKDAIPPQAPIQVVEGAYKAAVPDYPGYTQVV